jgi:hypothetical protein
VNQPVDLNAPVFNEAERTMMKKEFLLGEERNLFHNDMLYIDEDEYFENFYFNQ